MKQRRLWVILLLALVSGGAAAYLALAYLRDRTPRLVAAEAPHVQVAVAARDLPLGTILGPADVRMIDWLGESVPPGYLHAAPDAVGRGLISSVKANEMLLESRLAPRGAGGGLQVTIPDGQRAVSVRVDDVIGVAGFILPGTRVDVVVTLPPEPQLDQKMSLSQIVLQNVQVLAAGQTVQQDAQGKPITVSVITLLVSPKDAETLVLASNEGKIQLALRNTLDLADIRTSGASVRSLLPGQRATGDVAARPRAPTPEAVGTVVEAYKGGVRTLVKF
ncbi:MAG TPA: Flp pilus assembly protein CpaB [Gemmatimonadales bacterium]|nr:Flp pilus assembly protein CpaB [Gemmatimonadales bacterium]